MRRTVRENGRQRAGGAYGEETAEAVVDLITCEVCHRSDVPQLAEAHVARDANDGERPAAIRSDTSTSRFPSTSSLGQSRLVSVSFTTTTCSELRVSERLTARPRRIGIASVRKSSDPTNSNGTIGFRRRSITGCSTRASFMM